MKAKAAALLYACFALLAGAVHAGPITPDFSVPPDSASWAITHAEATHMEGEGKRVIHLDAEGDSANGIVGLALPRAVAFSSGSIEIDLKGKNVRGRSFLGVAFNVVDEHTFEAIYFRPFNFKADEPFRHRAVQYIAWPQHTWEHLRTNSPGQFENAILPVPDPDNWFHARVDVSDTDVKVYVNKAQEPSLVARRLSKGGILRPAGLFVDSSDGHYANLAFTPAKPLQP
jgi:hypothetical protein